jgi:flavodoxin
MNEIGIVYATMTKHSRKLATAIGRALHAEAENVKENPSLKEAGLLFIVGGIYGGESLPELVNFLNGLDGRSIKRAALVTSCASKKQGQNSVRALLEAKGIEVAGELICKGSFLFMGLGHPNKSEVEEAVRFACRLAGKERELA